MLWGAAGRAGDGGDRQQLALRGQRGAGHGLQQPGEPGGARRGRG